MTPTEQTPALPWEQAPEGVELYRIGVAGENDFECVGPLIMKGVRPGAASGMIVRPKKGWSFQPLQLFDIKELKLVDGPQGAYMAVKQQEVPLVITATLKVQVTNSFDQSIVDKVLDALKTLPGFVSLERL